MEDLLLDAQDEQDYEDVDLSIEDRFDRDKINWARLWKGELPILGGIYERLKTESDPRMSVEWSRQFSLVRSRWDFLDNPSYFLREQILGILNSLSEETYRCIFNTDIAMLFVLERTINHPHVVSLMGQLRRDLTFKSFNRRLDMERKNKWRTENREAYNEYMRSYSTNRLATASPELRDRIREQRRAARHRRKAKIRAALAKSQVQNETEIIYDVAAE